MFHTIIIVGNLGRDPEMRYMPNGNPVTTMNIATSHKYTGSDGQLVDETTWFRVSVFGKQAESCNQYLKKGRSVLVEGRLKPDLATGGPRVWTRQDGTPGASFEVTASTVRFLGRAGGDGSPVSGGFAETPSSSSEDDIPF
ncbi:MAG: single-stranded DNA-binding protein [Anaerolineales bacterium]|nr:single-stranded DNA-binding protein [Anaerolineales bacterium]